MPAQRFAFLILTVIVAAAATVALAALVSTDGAPYSAFALAALLAAAGVAILRNRN